MTGRSLGLGGMVLLLSSVAPLPVRAGEAAPVQPTLASPDQPAAPSELTRIEIDLSSRRLTTYRGSEVVDTYPIAVGRQGWQTPVGSFQVLQMVENPAWMHPLTRQVTPSGDPSNPLGRYFIGFWTDNTNWIGMHGTPNPESVGRAVSHGCIRLYNEDIEALFAQVRIGLPVVVVP